jgi:cysteinyl-tRNA synthetase
MRTSAQATAAGHEFARHWIHFWAWSSSAARRWRSLPGTSLTLRDALAPYDARAIRLAMLQTNYARTVDLGPDELDAASAALARLDALVRRAAQAGVASDGSVIDEPTLQAFTSAMVDDFNTPQAIAEIFDANSRANLLIDAGDAPGVARRDGRRGGRGVGNPGSAS